MALLDPRERSDRGDAAAAPPTSLMAQGWRDVVLAEVRSRPGLERRAIAGDTAADIPIFSHVHPAMASSDCTPAEMQEFVLQYAVHAGWPRASVIQVVVDDMTRKVAVGLPWNG